MQVRDAHRQALALSCFYVFQPTVQHVRMRQDSQRCALSQNKYVIACEGQSRLKDYL